MYICSCHAVTDGAMRAAIKSGTRTFAKMAKLTGVATGCGICGRQAKECFYGILREEEELERTGLEQPAEPSCASPCGSKHSCALCPSNAVGRGS